VVSDTGEGITPEFLPHVFDRFRQSDASISRRASGLGLGLAIVRHLVELHAGRVTAESPGRGQGATFTVRLPLRPVRSHSDPSLESADLSGERAMGRMPDLSGVRILVVDDEADTRDLLREVLMHCGADVQGADSAELAFEIVQSWGPKVIVSDIGMPGEDGYAFIRRVREWERASGVRIPAVALTAYARSEDRIRTLLAGYQVHVAKPIEPMEFALVVAGAIQSKPSGP
jgi:CheY-like chemotaxis protein